MKSILFALGLVAVQAIKLEPFVEMELKEYQKPKLNKLAGALIEGVFSVSDLDHDDLISRQDLEHNLLPTVPEDVSGFKDVFEEIYTRAEDEEGEASRSDMLDVAFDYLFEQH